MAKRRKTPMGMSVREREAIKRAQRRADIEQSLRDGTLVIRKMTPAERTRWPPLSAAEKARNRRGRRM